MGVITYVAINLITGKAKKKEDQRSDVCTGSAVCPEIYFPVNMVKIPGSFVPGVFIPKIFLFLLA